MRSTSSPEAGSIGTMARMGPGFCSGNLFLGHIELDPREERAAYETGSRRGQEKSFEKEGSLPLSKQSIPRNCTSTAAASCRQAVLHVEAQVSAFPL